MSALIDFSAWEFDAVKLNGISYPTPSGFKMTTSKVSSPKAGRGEDGGMHTMVIGTCYKFFFKWKNITSSEASDIMTLFAPDEISVKYYDFLTHNYRTTSFYSGDNDLTLYSSALDIVDELSLNIVEIFPLKRSS